MTYKVKAGNPLINYNSTNEIDIGCQESKKNFFIKFYLTASSMFVKSINVNEREKGLAVDLFFNYPEICQEMGSFTAQFFSVGLKPNNNYKMPLFGKLKDLDFWMKYSTWGDNTLRFDCENSPTEKVIVPMTKSLTERP